ncbi:hypothetical protein [Paenibacillus massiliensis]|nr:hypothetical protein [Paenibacillus massiliensis]
MDYNQLISARAYCGYLNHISGRQGAPKWPVSSPVLSLVLIMFRDLPV